MDQINNTKKPPQFDGTNYPYWKSKITTHIKSINRKVWKVVETKIEIEDLENPTVTEEVLLQNNDIALSAIQMPLMRGYLNKPRTWRWLMRLGRSWMNHLRAPRQ
jgi:hypothetical protein